MLKSLLTPLTTPTANGTSFRDAIIAIGTIITILGTLGILDDAQIAKLRQVVELISLNWPAFLVLFGIISTLAMSVYRRWSLSRSKEADNVARQIDKDPAAQEAAANATKIEIKTPAGSDNVTVAIPDVKP